MASKRFWWHGGQWAVTSHGLESLDGSYSIPKNRLLEPDWPDHMRTKDWVWHGEFTTALAVARRMHGSGSRGREEEYTHTVKGNSGAW